MLLSGAPITAAATNVHAHDPRRRGDEGREFTGDASASPTEQPDAHRLARWTGRRLLRSARRCGSPASPGRSRSPRLTASVMTLQGVGADADGRRRRLTVFGYDPDARRRRTHRRRPHHRHRRRRARTRRSSSTATRRRTASGTAASPYDVSGYEFGEKPFDPFSQPAGRRERGRRVGLPARRSVRLRRQRHHRRQRAVRRRRRRTPCRPSASPPTAARATT